MKSTLKSLLTWIVRSKLVIKGDKSSYRFWKCENFNDRQRFTMWDTQLCKNKLTLTIISYFPRNLEIHPAYYLPTLHVSETGEAYSSILAFWNNWKISLFQPKRKRYWLNLGTSQTVVVIFVTHSRWSSNRLIHIR